MLRVVVYGWVIPESRFNGPGSGTFVDMTYYLEDNITVGEILNVINQSGFKMVPLRYQGQVVSDKISIDEVEIGAEPVNEPIQTLTNEEYQQGGYY